MLGTEERRNQIEELVMKNKEIKVADLKRMFKVSGVTVRNDLIYLERKGVLRRNFGGAVLKENGYTNIIDSGTIKNLYEKEKIGRYAASLINENESVMIYTGSTTLQLAKYMSDLKNIIGVTNSLAIAYELGKNPYIKVILIGGYYEPDNSCTYGEQAIRQLNEYNLDKLFLAADGVSAEGGLTNDHPFEAELNKAMIAKANKVILMVDYSKIGITRFINMGSLKDIDLLITDNKAPRDELDKIQSMGIEVVVV
ncbi:MAG: DeoR/GlpR family DNA-binding transcription regulator [Mahellales bacterium]|jgi:DeoR/GlpR family transcriptional regulator of sugar metabolism